FHPWWAANPAVKADNGALAALYTNNGNALAAVLNDSDKPVTVTLTFDGKFNLNDRKCSAVFSKKNYQLNGRKLVLTLAPREGELFLFGK
ncbi:MAG: hypothetical protein IKC82_01045, partial [Lentisphaeria bacterium]|nr:hypothetical protein [Lentisphaeria bacterium]